MSARGKDAHLQEDGVRTTSSAKQGQPGADGMVRSTATFQPNAMFM